MKTFKCEIELKAEDKEQAKIKIDAIQILLDKLKPNEIQKLAQVVKNDPIKTAFAKRALGV